MVQSVARVSAAGLVVSALAFALACEGPQAPCSDDADGVSGGDYTFVVTVDDTSFTPALFAAQNGANVTLTVKNAGTKPHDFVIDCLPTPNDLGCPTSSCFEAGAAFAALAPGASETHAFVTPTPEGIYTFRSDLPGDAQTGQFVVQ